MLGLRIVSQCLSVSLLYGESLKNNKPLSPVLLGENQKLKQVNVFYLKLSNFL